MADYNVVFYNINTTGTFSTAIGGTYNYAGPATADGTAVITDNEAGVGGQNLDDDNNGGELATATATVGGLTSTGSTVDAEISWTVRDTVTGEEFQLVQFQIEQGDAAGSYLMSEIPLVPGRTYETLEYDTNPNADAGAPAFNYADHANSEFFLPPSDGTVTGTAGNDLIDDSFFDATDGDTVTSGDDIVSAGAGNDTVLAGAGNDTIDAGAGDDTVYADSGDDSVSGGTGNDTIIGNAGDDTVDGGAGNDFIVGDNTLGLDGEDSISGGAGNDTIYGDTQTPASGSRVTEFSWADQNVADETSVAGGLTGTTANGEVQVELTVAAEANFTSASMETTDGLYDFDDRDDSSSLEIFGGSAGTSGDAATLTLDFTQAASPTTPIDLENVSFGIFDIDELQGQFIDQVIIRAYDAAGNQVPVTISIGSGTTLTSSTDANGTATAESIVNSGGSGNVNAQTGFIEVNIAGPVASIEIDYNNTDTAFGAHAIRIGDLEMTVPNSTTDGEDDVIDGGTGSDTIFGQGGNDTIQGGADSDSIYGGTGDDVISDNGTTTDYIEGGAGNDSINAGAGNDTVYGGADNDTINGAAGADTIYGGTGNDTAFGGTGEDRLFGGDGNDTLDGDDGNDSLFGGAGNDVLIGDAGRDSLFGGTGDDGIYASSGNNTAEGGSGNDSIYMGTGNDTVSGGNDDDTIYGGAGNDRLSGDAGNDRLEGGDGNDTLTGGTGNDSVIGGQGSDRIVLGEGFGTDNIDGTDDAGDTDVDVLDASAMTSDITLDLSGTDPEAGTLTAGLNTATFDNIETVTLGSGDDTVTGSTGDDSITAGDGADTINMGAGNDTVDLGAGAPDLDADLIVLQDNFGDDVVTNFDAPTPNGDGTFTGIDTLDVRFLFDLPSGNSNREPVNTDDVTVTDDGSGNAVLNFPNGETLTLDGISPTDADDPAYLNAIGIPLPGAITGDGIVSGDATDNIIDLAYTGDPDGDMVDSGDALLATEFGDDDIIEGLGGNDSIIGGAGDDQIFGDASADVNAGVGQPAGQLFTDATNIQTGSATGDPTDAQVGDSIIYDDAATLADGTIVAIRVTVVSMSDPNVQVILNDSQASSPIRVVGGANENGDSVQFQVEFLDQLTGEPLTLTGQATIVDIDDNNALSSVSGIENVQFDANDIDSYSTDANTSLTVSETGGVITATGTEVNNSTDQDAWFSVGFEDRSELNFTVGVVDGTANYGFSGLDLADPVTTVVGAGNDTIDAGDGNDYIAGNGGDDVITGGAGDDTILGGTGSDTIFGGGGDIIFGGEDLDGTDVDVLNLGNVVAVNYTDVDGNAVAGPTEYGTVDYVDGTTLSFAEIETLNFTIQDGTVEGTSGNDVIDGSYVGDPNGDMVDNNDAILAGDTGNDDLIYGYDGDDSITAGDGNDEVYAGTGNDTVDGGDGNDTIDGGFGFDTLYGGAGDDTIFEGSTGGAQGTLYGGTGNDTLYTGTGLANDVLYGGDDDDLLIDQGNTDSDDILDGGAGNDSIQGGLGDDTVVLNEGFGIDTITGGEDVAGDDIDTLDASGMTSDVTLDLSAGDNENGTLTDGTNTATFDDIETVTLGSGDDIVIGSASDDSVTAGTGADTINAGAGNDTVDLGAGSPDGDADVVVLQDGFGDDVVQNFDAPTPNGDGTFTGIDTLDTTNLFDLPLGDPDRTPVMTNDVVVTDDGSGNALLTFPNGETITLVGISPTDAADPFYLNAIGIPMPDGTVEGTAGADVINQSYTGDPDGDVVDGDDAILAGDTNNDDLIYGYAGNDSITGGDGSDEIYGGGDDDTIGGFSTDAGNDTMFGGAGNDSINGGTGDDTVYGGTGNDTLTGGTGNDTIDGGQGSDNFQITDDHNGNTIIGGEDVGDTDIDDITLANFTSTDGATVTYSGDEAGNIDFNGTTSTVDFVEIEEVNTTDFADTVDGTASTGGIDVSTYDGDDSVIGGSGDDDIQLGTGADTVEGGAGNDTIDLGQGTPDGDADVIILEDGFGDDVINSFDAPTPNGDGTFTGIDTLDTTGLFDLPLGDPARTPVLTNDVTVTDDGNGNAVLNFPNGETITLVGISPTDADDPFYLNAIGIPMPDGTVSGTAGDDTINGSYLGDPDGDIVDNGDAIIPGHAANDDLIEAAGGNDTIYSGEGSDTIYAGAGDDRVFSGAGDDTIFGEAGNDTISASDDNDVIFGGADNDLIFGGGGTDSIDGGTGNDIINGGTGADTLLGGDGADEFVQEAGFGNDTITGGEGGLDNDTIRSTQDINTTTVLTGDEAGTITDGTSTATFTQIETIDLQGGDDIVDASASDASITVFGGAGEDTITGSTADDRLDGEVGDDTIAGGAGADSMIGGFGDDTFIMEDGFGADTINGSETGEVNGDTIDGSALTQDVTVTFTSDEGGGFNNGTDYAVFGNIEQIETGAGDDTIIGYDGDQDVITGAGNDTITTTGTGSDTIDTGAGDDTVVFSEGDSISGGTGDDTFTYENLGEPTNGTITIVGGQGGETPDDADPNTLEGDTLNLGFDADFSTLNITSTTTNVDGNESYTGTIQMDDGTLLEFSEIENIICFTPGTRIATPTGARDIATLRVGDMVVTRDHGLQPIRWIQQRTVPAMDRFAPIRIKPGVVTGQERDLLVSPQHRMMFQGYRAELLFGESEVLVAAKHLIDGKLVTQDEGGDVTYIHMMFDEHEVVYAEGAATESFHPGEVGLSAVTDPAREELFALFPELRSNIGGYGQTARRCLKRHEANLLNV